MAVVYDTSRMKPLRSSLLHVAATGAWLAVLSGLVAGCGSMGLDQNALYEGNGRAEVAPDGMVEFPDRPVGRGSSEEFVVESIGDIPITVEDAWVDVDDRGVFFVGDLPFPMRLSPGDSVTFQVNFEPPSTGVFHGTLVITMDDGTTLERNVVGSGCGDNDGDGVCG